MEFPRPLGHWPLYQGNIYAILACSLALMERNYRSGIIFIVSDSLVSSHSIDSLLDITPI